MAALCNARIAEEFASIVSQRMKHRANAILSIGTVRGQWELPYSNQNEIETRLRRADSGVVEPNIFLRACFHLVLEPENASEMLFVFVPKEMPAFCILKSHKIELTAMQQSLAVQADASFSCRLERLAVRVSNAYISEYQAPNAYRVCAHDKMHMWCIILNDNVM